MEIMVFTLVAVYMMCIIPLLVGYLCKTSINKYAIGYMVTFATFLVLAVVTIRFTGGIKVLSIIWSVLAILVLVATIVLRKNEIIADVKGFGKKLEQLEKLEKIALMAMALVALFSLFFVKPNPGDHTVAVVDMAVTTGTAYQYHPYTGEQMVEAVQGSLASPIEMYYAVIALVSGLDSVVTVQYVATIAMLCLFYAVHAQIGEKLFASKKYGSLIFVGIVVVLYFSSVYIADQSLVAGIFCNSWNGSTLLHCVVLPELFYLLLDLMDKLVETPFKDYKKYMGLFPMIAITLLAAQLVSKIAIWYAVLVLGLTILVILVRKGGRRYGTKTSND